MKSKLLSILSSSIGNGFIKNIVSARGTGADAFLFETWKDYVLENYTDDEVIDSRDYDKQELKDICIECKKSNKHCFILINHIWTYSEFDSIINLCCGSSNIDVFTISYSKWPLFSPDKWTLVRGRMYTVHYPSTLYEDYILQKSDGSVIDYLVNNTFDSDVITLNLNLLSDIEKKCLKISLQHDNEPLTYRTLAAEVSKQTGLDFSRYHAQTIFSHFVEMNILYLIDRFDIKRNKVIGGKLVFPIDTRFYGDKKTKIKSLNKYMTAAMISKMFYDNWNVQKCIYISQRDKRTFDGNTDGGFLIKKDEQSFIVFVSDFIDDAVIKKAKLTPSLLPKIILTLDLIGDMQFGSDGIIYYSYEKFLKEGINIYGKW